MENYADRQLKSHWPIEQPKWPSRRWGEAHWPLKQQGAGHNAYPDKSWTCTHSGENQKIPMNPFVEQAKVKGVAIFTYLQKESVEKLVKELLGYG